MLNLPQFFTRGFQWLASIAPFVCGLADVIPQTAGTAGALVGVACTLCSIAERNEPAR